MTNPLIVWCCRLFLLCADVGICALRGEQTQAMKNNSQHTCSVNALRATQHFPRETAWEFDQVFGPKQFPDTLVCCAAHLLTSFPRIMDGFENRSAGRELQISPLRRVMDHLFRWEQNAEDVSMPSKTTSGCLQLGKNLVLLEL